MKAAFALADVTEKTWQQQVVDLARTLGWDRAYHTFDSRRSSSGFPDLLMVRDRQVISELKREGGKPTEAQRKWLDALAAAGQEVYLWLPHDLDEVARILSKRWTLDVASWSLFWEWTPGGEVQTFQPASLWIPGLGRADTLEKGAAVERPLSSYWGDFDPGTIESGMTDA